MGKIRKILLTRILKVFWNKVFWNKVFWNKFYTIHKQIFFIMSTLSKIKDLESKEHTIMNKKSLTKKDKSDLKNMAKEILKLKEEFYKENDVDEKKKEINEEEDDDDNKRDISSRDDRKEKKRDNEKIDDDLNDILDAYDEMIKAFKISTILFGKLITKYREKNT
jgi:hypothetical protein